MFPIKILSIITACTASIIAGVVINKIIKRKTDKEKERAALKSLMNECDDRCEKCIIADSKTIASNEDYDIIQFKEWMFYKNHALTNEKKPCLTPIVLTHSVRKTANVDFDDIVKACTTDYDIVCCTLPDEDDNQYYSFWLFTEINI